MGNKLRVKWMWGSKDGGPESRVWMWGLEIKGLFSLLVLQFKEGSREAFHTHAFNCISWVLRGGGLKEVCRNPYVESVMVNTYRPSLRPVRTGRGTFHKVDGIGPSTWVLTFRGPWAATWAEHLPATGEDVALTHGRKVVASPDRPT